MSDQTQPIPTQRPASGMKIGTILVFVVIAVVVAGITFVQVRNFVTAWNFTSLPGIAIINKATPTPGAPGEENPLESTTPPEISAPSGPTPDPWDGASRVNILIIGLDSNDWRAGEGSPRSDTMILFTLDPVSQSAGMVSIPRDLWVNIPGFNHGKINTAYQLGESFKLPDGGPGLAMKTVEHFLGVPVHYYAQIDFAAFEYFIDEIDGVKIDVPYNIVIDIYGDDRGEIHLKPGVQTLSGAYALAYARARHTEGGDFARAQRQQQIIISIQKRMLKYDMIPTLIAKGPALYAELSSGVNTNLSIEEIFQLAWAVQGIDSEDILTGIIGSEYVTLGKSPDGLDILKPISEKIRALRDSIFATSGLTSPMTYDGMDSLDLMVAESAQIIILNGTLTPGLAGRTSEYLQSLGANVIAIGDAELKPYAHTNIYDHSGNPYALRYFSEMMNLSEFRIHTNYAPGREEDITIILGDDWIYNNPMP